MRTLSMIVFGSILALGVVACGDEGGDATTTGSDATSGSATEGGESGTSADGTSATSGDAEGQEGAEGDASEAAGPDTTSEEPVECVPACEGKECGDNGCGGSCGMCSEASASCVNGACCVPDCGDKACGDDGCGGSCGACAAGEQCTANACEAKSYTCSEMFSVAQAADCDWNEDFSGCQTSITDAYQASSDSEAESLVALLTCLDTQGCDVTQGNAQLSCQKENCLSETASCEASQFGALMCFEITQCMQDTTCPKDLTSGEPTATCRRQCLEQGSQTAVEFWLDLELCGLSECLGEADQKQCVTDVANIQCVTEYGDCYDEAQQ